MSRSTEMTIGRGMVPLHPCFQYLKWELNKSDNLKVSALFENVLPLMNILLYVRVTALFVWEKELIAWGKLNLCKQVDKVLKLIYLDADWSAAQWCLNRLLTSVPTPLFFFFLAAQVHLACGASCNSHVWGWKSESRWRILSKSCFSFLIRSWCIILLGRHTKRLFPTLGSISRCNEIVPGTAKDLKQGVKCAIKQNRNHWCLSHKTGSCFCLQVSVH